MKHDHKLLLIIGFVMILVFFFLGKSCGNRSPQSVSEDKYVDDRSLTEEHIKNLEEAVKEKEAKIVEMEAELNGSIDSHNTVIAEKEEEIQGLDNQIARERKAREKLKGYEALYHSEKREKEMWIEKFSLAEVEIKELRGVIFDLNKKYDTRVKLDGEIIFAEREKYRREHALRLASEDLCKEFKLALKSEKRKKAVGYITTALAVGVGGYLAIKK